MVDFALVNFSIFMMLAGLAAAMRWLHHRRFLTLVAPDARIDWGRIARGARVWAALGVVTVAAEHWLYPDRYYLSFDAQRFFPFAALVLVLTPIQCAAEELVFRGYVMQGLSLFVRSPLAIAVASSVIFTIPHLLNPEVERHGLLLMGAVYFTIGMVLATVALRDGRLELAIGLHAANNLFLALVANYEGSALMTESLFTARELDPRFSLITLVLAAFAFHWWVFGRRRGISGAAAC